jgi:hypothetical protein
MKSEFIASVRDRVADTRADLLEMWAEFDEESTFTFQDKDISDDELTVKGLARVGADECDLPPSWQGDIVCRKAKVGVA